mmetsp:Transcript_3458/g.8887  ORF Transcript_3458/g.8887 Transcript_3458/m.8887 type:complete len:92 (+) Transcript_3458:2-277(+)
MGLRPARRQRRRDYTNIEEGADSRRSRGPLFKYSAPCGRPPASLGGLRELGVVGLDDADDDAEDAEGRGEDLDDQDLDEERRVLGIGEGAG